MRCEEGKIKGIEWKKEEEAGGFVGKWVKKAKETKVYDLDMVMSKESAKV